LIDLEKAKFAPQSVFDSPEAVEKHGELTDDQKIEILQRWYYDAAEIQVAQEEGMSSGEDNSDETLRRIVLALERLIGDGVEQPGPTKQGHVPTTPRKNR
jgi:hypothetical protein